jgi:hypothetical protein
MYSLYKSSDIALKDFYFDLGRWVVVSTKCPNEKDLKWRYLCGRKGLFVLLMDGQKVIKTIRRENVNKVFDVPITAAARNDMPYRNSPAITVVSPEPIVPTVKEKKLRYIVCAVDRVHTDSLVIAGVCTSLKEAQDLAEKRAKTFVGQQFVVLQVLGKVTVGVPVWE